MARYLSLNCGLAYFFSKSLGAVLGLTEGEPEAVHAGLLRIVQAAFARFARDHPALAERTRAGLQVNTREFYFQEPGMTERIMGIYRASWTASQADPGATIPVMPSIHQANGAQPLPDCADFLPQLRANCQLARSLGSRNITVHLPVRARDDTDAVVATLTRPDVLAVVKGTPDAFPLSIDLENNHHNTFFGNLDHCRALLDALDARLRDLGEAGAIPRYNICFDYGHYITQAHKMGYDKRAMLTRFFRAAGDRVKTLHLHMNDGSGDQHLLVAGHIPDATGTVQGRAVDPTLLAEHARILLEALPLLHLWDRDDWNIVTETDTPYTAEMLARSFATLCEHL